VDDSERDRLRPARRDTGVPGTRAVKLEWPLRAGGGPVRVIGWSDYLDGFAARLTGQYSRLGALLDPFVDRLLIVSGMVVCWDFGLLPRWAIAIVIARELLMLVLSQYALRTGSEIRINWPGRIGVAPIAGAPFIAMAGVHWLALILLYVGMALGLVATVLYVRRGAAEIRARSRQGEVSS
jgi:cardiolipin synthase